MFNLVKKLFDGAFLLSYAVQDGLLFLSEEKNPKEQFWVLITQAEYGEILNRQAELFSSCKAKCEKREFDKNVSMLVLWDITQEHDREKIKREVMSIEENPYFFKKYVLYYSSAELKELTAQVSEGSILEFVRQQSANTNVFGSYKVNPNAQNWPALLYRLVIKIPFLEMAIGAAKNLDNLFDENEKKLSSSSIKGLADLDKRLIELFSSEGANVQKMTSDEWLKILVGEQVQKDGN